MNRPPASALSLGVVGGSLALIECMRPAQWIKNLFILSPLLFSMNLHNPNLLRGACLMFAAFCAAASGIYLWNDSLDWRGDLVHPEKRHRPIPSGRLSPALAMSLGTLLLAGGVTLAFLINAPSGAILALYVVMNYLYTLWLKHMAILDIMCIALGFVLRVMGGAAAIDVKASHWLLMCTFLLALFLGIAKRRHEIRTLAQDSARHRKVLLNYSVEWLDQAGTMVCGATVVAYALYTVAPDTQARLGTDRLIYTLPLVVFGILRYLYMMHREGRTGNPSAAVLADRPLLACVVVWAVACAAIVYS